MAEETATGPGRNAIPSFTPTGAVFIGDAPAGPVNQPESIPGFPAFAEKFGPLAANLELGYAVRQFFLNGGSSAWVVRAGANGTDAGVIPSIRALEAVDVFNLLALPGTTAPAVLRAAAEYCRKRRAFLAADSPRGAATPSQVSAAIASGAIPSTINGAVYYPWIKVPDPLNPGQPRLTPPSGTVVGLMSCADSTWGVWKAPAGSEIPPRGVQGLEYSLNESEAEQLNALGVNCFRDFPEHGPLLWGTRTLAGSDTAESEWKYVPIRRLALFLEQSIERGTHWAIFEPNEERLWARIRLEVGAFLRCLFRQGAFQGQKPQDAYFVRCDDTTTTAPDVAFGVVNIEIGFAPLRPGEFVILRLQQKAQPPGA
jgi:phage tail sheath protein FI